MARSAGQMQLILCSSPLQAADTLYGLRAFVSAVNQVATVLVHVALAMRCLINQMERRATSELLILVRNAAHAGLVGSLYSARPRRAS